MIEVMRTFGWTPTDEELKDMVNVIDQVEMLRMDFAPQSLLTGQDGDGDISFNEFVWLMTR